MPLPPALREKFRPMFLLMTTSDSAGEREAARNKLTQMLKSNGIDWYDLTAEMLSDSPPPSVPPPTPTPEPRLKERFDGRFEIPSADLSALVQTIRVHVRCDSWTDEFLIGMEDRAVRWNPVILTDKTGSPSLPV